MPKLTIIIPCYNCEKTLVEAFSSCYKQGFSESDFEIIMVDDKSTDGTATLIEQLTREHSNSTLIRHEQNLGGGAARNTAALAATSPVIFCLDSDDILPSGTLLKMYDFLVAKNADAVGVHHSTKFNGTDPDNIDYVTTFAYAGERIPLENLLQKDGWCSLYSVFMFTKSAFTVTGGYPTHHGFDTQGFAWRFLGAGLAAYTCPNTNYLHRVNFHASYYQREYNQGRTNINMQLVLLEQAHLLTPQARALITHYPVQDFTKDLFFELCALPQVFLPEQNRIYSTINKKYTLPQKRAVARNSLLGIFYRIRSRIRKSIWKT